MNVPVKSGMLLRHQGHFYYVEDVVEHHAGQRRPTYHVTLREVRDGRHLTRTVEELMPLEEVAGGYRAMQYLYAKGEAHMFMDSETFEEHELSGPALQGFEPFLKEGDEYRVLFVGGQPLQLDVPPNLVVKVADTAAPTHAVGTSANIMKEATLENGLTVHVPLFIKTGDEIKLDVKKREYLGKA